MFRYSLENSNTSKVFLTAHRGQSATRPENTLASFREAKKLGAYSIELDTMLTRDKQIVVIHDQSLLRVSQINKLVCDFTLKELQSISAPNGFENFRNEKIPSLEETIIWSQKNDIVLEIEIKENNNINEYLNALYLLLKKCPHTNNLIIISFDHVILKEIKNKIGIKTEAIIHCRPIHIDKVVSDCKADIVSIEYNRFDISDAKLLKKLKIMIRLSLPNEEEYSMYKNKNIFLKSLIEKELIDFVSSNDISYLKKLLKKAYNE